MTIDCVVGIIIPSSYWMLVFHGHACVRFELHGWLWRQKKNTKKTSDFQNCSFLGCGSQQHHRWFSMGPQGHPSRKTTRSAPWRGSSLGSVFVFSWWMVGWVGTPWNMKHNLRSKMLMPFWLKILDLSPRSFLCFGVGWMPLLTNIPSRVSGSIQCCYFLLKTRLGS